MVDDPDPFRPPSDLETLNQRIEAARDQHAPESPSPQASNLGAAFRLATEMVAGVVVGGGLGWVLDAWLNTKPAFLLIFLALGMAAGFFNVLRTARQMNERSR